MGSKKTVVFQTEWFNIEEQYLDLPTLNGKPFYTINSEDGVVILATTEKGEIILVKQYRPAHDKVTIELPSGGVDEKETPEQAAKRELYEETGYQCKDMYLLGKGKLMINRLSASVFAFYCDEAIKDTTFFAKEDIDVILVKPDDFKTLTINDQIEQYSMLGLLILADWKIGTRFVTGSFS